MHCMEDMLRMYDMRYVLVIKAHKHTQRYTHKLQTFAFIPR